MRTRSLAAALESKEILVVCGSGGVGKTSVSAALALAAAKTRKTIVVTIDPAKRLASALGIRGALGHHESRVDIGGDGWLHAAMLDMKTAWDELVDRYAPTHEVADDIKGNRLYQSLSEHFVGSQGYMAMERLADLHGRGEYDLVVVDTPPTRRALDFLEAPKRMTSFVGGSLLRWLARPYAVAGRFGLRAFNVTAAPFLRVADRVLGSQVLADLSAFVIDFQTLYDRFKQRAEEVTELLHDHRSGFVVVTTLEGAPLEEAGFFLDRLTDERLPLAGVVANRVVPAEFASAEAGAALQAIEERAASDDVLRAASTALEGLSTGARRDATRLAELTRRAHVPVAAVPLLTHDISDVPGLYELSRYLLESR